MSEKIKITLSESVAETLKNDCKNFNITKKDDSPNINEFLNKLVVNYYERFTASEEVLRDKIKRATERIPDRYKDNVFNDVISIICDREGNFFEGDSVTISFKPTKFSEKAVLFIENILELSESLSSFYRRLFSSYASRPQPQRETIIFKENYEILQKAIKKEVKVSVSLKKETLKSLSVYAVQHAKEELFNYVLMTDGDSLYTVRLANIKSVFLLTEKALIDEKTAIIFERQIRCGVQYPIFKEEEELIKVKFSKHGLFMFERIYLYRPVPVKKDGNIFWFDCSLNQATYYFKRFGRDAVILEPRKTALEMLSYYEDAVKKCRRSIAAH